MGSNTKGSLFALLAFAIYSTHDAIVKHLGVDYSTFQIIFFSVLFSFPLAVLAIIGDSTPGTLKPAHPRWVLLRTLAAVTSGMSAFYAFTALPMAQAYAILFATPLLVTVLAIPLLGETVRIRRWLAVLVGLAGVMIVIRPGQASLGLGHLAALLAATSGALSAVVMRRVGSGERPVVLLLYPMLANLVLMGMALPFVYRPMPLAHLGLLACMSVLGWTAGLVQIHAYRSGEAVVVAPMQYSQIIWAAVFGLLIFNETPDGGTALGAAVIIASGLYIVLREGRSTASATRPALHTRARPESPAAPRPSLLRRFISREDEAG
ncbi:MAG: DMT family transporter [Rubellimicrobium sp.]|nr:DMT family transporter [Rubellimicrobium sp.]